MTIARGIHDHPELKLGRRDPSQTPALRLGDHLRAGELPAHPAAVAAPPLSWPMDHNDEWGDCVVAGVDHALQAIAGLLGTERTNWTDGQILAYYRTQNPDFDPAGTETTNGPGSGSDGGMDIQSFLSYLVKEGTLLGFAKVDPADDAEVEAAIYLGLAVVTGETLEVAQQTQKVWDHVARSPEWGGHCTTWVGYGDGRDICVTWGTTIPMTLGFVSAQVEEAWFLVTRELADHPTFRAGFDLASYAAAYTAITGRPFPIAVPPQPQPPQPPQPPSGTSYEISDPAVAARVEGAAKRKRTSGADWLTGHLRRYFGVS